jgi:hypothetical protein
MAREGERKVRKVVNMDLGLCVVSRCSEVCRRKSYLVCACGHDPVAILGDSHTLAGFLEVKVLQQLNAIREFGVVLQAPKKVLARVLLRHADSSGAPLSSSYQPFGKRSRLTATDGVHGHRRVGDLHPGLGRKALRENSQNSRRRSSEFKKVTAAEASVMHVGRLVSRAGSVQDRLSSTPQASRPLPRSSAVLPSILFGSESRGRRDQGYHATRPFLSSSDSGDTRSHVSPTSPLYPRGRQLRQRATMLHSRTTSTDHATPVVYTSAVAYVATGSLR